MTEPTLIPAPGHPAEFVENARLNSPRLDYARSTFTGVSSARFSQVDRENLNQNQNQNQNQNENQTQTSSSAPDCDLLDALGTVIARQASDLHVTVGSPPAIRENGDLDPLELAPVWSKAKVERAVRSILSAEQEAIFDRHHELDFAYTLEQGSRFRVNVYQQRGAVGAVFRLIPSEIKTLQTLGIQPSVSAFSALPRGLVLVAGPTGSGKSTTLAALVDLVNTTRKDHIVTVEDPIEFLHTHKKSLVNQREVGCDTDSFASALKHVLRQDPDVILIGELRDLETIQVALTAAETGHLVFATLHTQSAAQTIDRLIDVFPPHQQNQVRSQLAQTLQGVICQTLVKRANGGGRVVATEVLITTSAIANLIREGKTHQIESMMQTGRDRGMHTLDQHLAALVNTGVITRQAGLDHAQDVEGLAKLVHRAERPRQTNGFAFASDAAGFEGSFASAGFVESRFEVPEGAQPLLASARLAPIPMISVAEPNLDGNRMKAAS
ncbi:type IV pilus twitching motility protein PilT [Cryobacterium sp. PH31-O1]|uniref:type IV pilus twitching motility protein PilT n=1 Tax=Cryobacterium sp. PH31-O1 TaxID=3046306 RepID=UPI0024BA11CA|nr:type IV pilus twitching motility protein PilT [Cryobacterium sp. PH31-O1]MDJ0337778.1 type IV pilus twitching motility protein PilT [Cryobacterium sp. PH31-O1]